MVELVVNDIVNNHGLKQYLVLDELTVLENYEKIFGSAGMSGIHNAFKIYGRSSFYEIKRYFQYIGILKYTGEYHSLTMSMFDIENIDNYLV
jgi:UDP-N-acetylenolpyruvoylglucosamine reductase